MKDRLSLLLVCLLLLGVACGSPEGDSALQEISAASARTNEAGTATVDLRMTVQAGGRAIEIDGTGVMDIEAQMASMVMTVESDQPGMPGMGQIEMVTDGLKVYSKYPPGVTASMPGNKPWTLIDMQAVGEAQGMDFAAMAQTSGSDPSQLLQYLQGVSGEVETVGQEDVRGVATTHYRATIDLDKAVDEASPELRDSVRASLEAMRKQMGTSEIPVEVWVGDDGYVHRMTMSTASGQEAEESFDMDMTMEMYDFGSPVTVEVPPPSKVTDITDMVIQGGRAP